MPILARVSLAGALELGGVLHRADADDRALALHQPRDGVVGAKRAGVGQRDRGAREVLRGQRAGAGLAHDVLVGRPELGEAHRLAALDRDDDEGALALALAGQVDGEAEVDVLGLHDRRLAVDLGEVAVHHRELGERLDDGVPDHVREADLAAAGAAQLVVDDDPVVGQQLGRHGAHARGGGHGERGVHVLHDERRRTAQGGGDAVGGLLGARGGACCGLRVGARGGLRGGLGGCGSARRGGLLGSRGLAVRRPPPGFSIGVSGEGAAVVSAAVCAAEPEVGEASPGR